MRTMNAPGRNDPCWCGSGKKYKRCHLGVAPPPEATAAPVIKAAPAIVAAPPVSQSVRKGIVSPMRSVPAHIARPSYAATGRPTEPRARDCLKTTPEEIERMRYACKIARQVLDRTLAAVAPGVTTEQLDIVAHEANIELGAYPSTLNYHFYPKSICTSVNEVVCHGIPDDRALQEGDIVNLDITVFIDGMHGDCSETAFVGKPDPQSRRLVETTYECMMAGIDAVKPGERLNEIGKAITAVAHRKGFSVVEQFAGHGIGEQFHMDPQILHYRDFRQRRRFAPGMTFTVEPMINIGTPKCVIWPDNWTAVTADGKRSAQFEHTLLVTEDGVDILTVGADGPYFRKQLAALGL
ncbi:MAG: methionyl aminopeptidase [Myxococcales bacterium]|nr:methionyl aminopeptidase [Myxococcales bacterium]